ncbi:hypothetical protein B0H11DRAFT_2292953 [Mycena galericulata]|nr:hypothetical protein B0H11DRAFT_2292953 [Mycena galericulata]
MHRSLIIPEIVELIFTHLRGDNPGELVLNQKYFAYLARTCRAFQHPALDILWSEQDTLQNVLKCLPSHLWELKREKTLVTIGSGPDARSNSYWKTVLRLIEPIRPADWNIPLKYARRIRVLKLPHQWQSGPSAAPSSAVFDTIAASLPQDHLCPNLRDISLDLVDTSLFPYIHLLLGRKIIAVKISFPNEDSESLPQLLPTLKPCLSELKRLTLTDDHDDFYLDCRTVSDIVMHLGRIEELTVDKLNRKAFEHLSRLSTLRSLDLKYPSLEDLGTSPSSPDGRSRYQPFPALRQVHFRQGIDYAIEFVVLLSDCCLDTFGIVCDGNFLSTAILGRLCKALGSHVLHSALEYLSIQTELDMPTPRMIASNDLITVHELAPLLSFENLTKLDLDIPWGFDIDDNAASDMARAWPKLITIRITAYQSPPSMTLDGLRAFAIHCKYLTYFSIPLNASTIPPFDQTRVSQDRLSVLNVRSSPISDPHAVARFLSGIFPKLVKISPGSRGNRDAGANWAQSKWKLVEEMVPTIAAVRREEEEYWVQKLSK